MTRIIDRRKGGDRRGIGRVPVSIDIEWQSGGGKRHGTISDISSSGCFVMAKGKVTNGDNIHLYIPDEKGGTRELVGEVANHAFEIGFAVRFRLTDSSQGEFVSRLIEQAS